MALGLTYFLNFISTTSKLTREIRDLKDDFDYAYKEIFPNTKAGGRPTQYFRGGENIFDKVIKREEVVQPGIETDKQYNADLQRFLKEPQSFFNLNQELTTEAIKDLEFDYHRTDNNVTTEDLDNYIRILRSGSEESLLFRSVFKRAYPKFKKTGTIGRSWYSNIMSSRKRGVRAPGLSKKRKIEEKEKKRPVTGAFGQILKGDTLTGNVLRYKFNDNISTLHECTGGCSCGLPDLPEGCLLRQTFNLPHVAGHWVTYKIPLPNPLGTYFERSISCQNGCVTLWKISAIKINTSTISANGRGSTTRWAIGNKAAPLLKWPKLPTSKHVRWPDYTTLHYPETINFPDCRGAFGDNKVLGPGYEPADLLSIHQGVYANDFYDANKPEWSNDQDIWQWGCIDSPPNGQLVGMHPGGSDVWPATYTEIKGRNGVTAKTVTENSGDIIVINNQHFMEGNDGAHNVCIDDPSHVYFTWYSENGKAFNDGTSDKFVLPSPIDLTVYYEATKWSLTDFAMYQFIKMKNPQVVRPILDAPTAAVVLPILDEEEVDGQEESGMNVQSANIHYSAKSHIPENVPDKIGEEPFLGV